MVEEPSGVDIGAINAAAAQMPAICRSPQPGTCSPGVPVVWQDVRAAAYMWLSHIAWGADALLNAGPEGLQALAAAHGGYIIIHQHQRS